MQSRAGVTEEAPEDNRERERERGRTRTETHLNPKRKRERERWSDTAYSGSGV